jgi:hypothetical protein
MLNHISFILILQTCHPSLEYNKNSIRLRSLLFDDLMLFVILNHRGSHDALAELLSIDVRELLQGCILLYEFVDEAVFIVGPYAV